MIARPYFTIPSAVVYFKGMLPVVRVVRRAVCPLPRAPYVPAGLLRITCSPLIARFAVPASVPPPCWSSSCATDQVARPRALHSLKPIDGTSLSSSAVGRGPLQYGYSMRAFPSAQARGVSTSAVAEDQDKGAVEEVDGMTRYPSAGSVRGLLRTCDYLGTVAFAVSGAVTAGSVGMDLLGAMLVGTVTAVGGGTLRDAVILRKTPFWVEETEYLWMSLLCAAAAFALWHTVNSEAVRTADGGEGPVMLWGDAVGVGAFAVVGAQNALRQSCPAVVVVLCGVVTATFGGLTRDTLCKLPGRILHSHADIYASTAAAGAATYYALRAAGLGVPLRILGGLGVGVGARWAAWTFGLRLPHWDAEQRPQRSRQPLKL